MSGRAVSSSEVTRSNSPGSVPSSAISETSASDRVSVPPPSSASAAIPSAAAAPQEAEGTPSPTSQSALPMKPAAEAASSTRARAASLSTAQASNRGAAPSRMTKRSVKGVMTGRGAAMSSASATSSGRRRARRLSSSAFCSALSATAVTETRPGATVILERGRSCRVDMAKRIAASQPSGTG